MAEAMDRLIELDEQASAKYQERAMHQALVDAVIEALPDGLVVTDTAGKIVLFNQKAEFMFGYHRNEVIGESVERLIPERFRGHHTHDREIYNRFDLSQRARRMGAVGRDLIGMRSDGHEFPTDITLARMVGPKGVYNLALVRFSPHAPDLDTVGRLPPETESDQNAKPDNDEPNAGQ